VLAALLLGAGSTAFTGCAADTPPAQNPPAAGPNGKPAAPESVADGNITVVATGDVLLHERLWTTAKRDGGNGEWDFTPLLQGVKPLVQPADLAVCHLETPLGTPPAGYPLFQGPPQIVPALVKTGYDACTTASNHSFDRGAAGIDRTLGLLDQAGIEHAGTARTPREAETPTLVTVRGVKIGLLSYTYGFNGIPYPAGQTWRAGTLDVGKIKAMARTARDAGAEIVVVSAHWGDEYSKTPNSQQRSFAKELLADSNIDLIIGHHAHVVQPVEQIDGKWVVYGLGNLVAAHRKPETTKSEGLLMRFTFRRDGDRWKADAQYAPLLMTDTVPVRVLDVQRELAKPGNSAVPRARLELAQRRTSETVGALGASPKML
jgi:poly-gamma-glutamate synthesis protein (capsule biosynthesis protein)